jgi:hypothetical protein
VLPRFAASQRGFAVQVRASSASKCDAAEQSKKRAAYTARQRDFPSGCVNISLMERRNSASSSLVFSSRSLAVGQPWLARSAHE